jgi:hypothetical protein
MAKKEESTQPLSPDQILRAIPPKRPGAGIPKNDRSVWKGVVVGADEFATARPKAKSRAGLALVLGVLGAAAAIGIFFAITTTSSEPSKPEPDKPQAASTAPAVPDAQALRVPADQSGKIIDARAPDAAPPVDAAVDAPIDAGEVDAGVDAGVPKAPVKKPPGKKKLPPKSKRKGH